jgi:protocatechuate 3,4-dioxygenase beta subunit
MPLRKVLVSLAAAEGGNDSGGASVTDAEGHFQIDGVQPGEYRVTLERNGFVSTNRRSHSYSSTSLTIAAGQNATSLLFRMLAAGVIQGKIVDEDGDPLAGVQVVAVSPTRQNGFGGTQTNDLGEYRIGGLPQGEFLVMALTSQAPVTENAKPNETRIYAPTFYPGTIDQRQATRIQVHSGNESSANFNLVSSKTFKVRGSVSGVAGRQRPNTTEPENATVLFHPLDGQMARQFQGPLLPNGSFEVGDVLPGSYKAQVIAPDPDGWKPIRTSQTIEVRDADVDGVQLSPEPPSQIRGRFRADTNNDQVPDWTQLNVEIDPDARNNFDGPVVGKVAKDGSFTLDVPAGNYHVVVTSNSNGESWRDFIVKEVLLNGKDVGDSGFVLAGGLTSLEIVASAQGSSIEGNVVDDDGKPIAGVLVVCIPDATRRKRRDIYQQVETDRQGHFALRGLNPGEYQVFTLDDPVGDITDPDFVAAHESLGQTVTLDPGERKGVVLKLATESQP